MEDLTIEQLQEELTKTQERAATNLAGWQRAQADYSNLMKEQDKMYKETAAWANAMLLAEILPVYNHFKLALKHIPEAVKEEPWMKGIEMIQKQFQDFLKKYQLEEIKTVGEKFNPNWHEALTHEEKDGFESDVVFEEIQPGYMLGDKVMMPAKVKVAK